MFTNRSRRAATLSLGPFELQVRAGRGRQGGGLLKARRWSVFFEKTCPLTHPRHLLRVNLNDCDDYLHPGGYRGVVLQQAAIFNRLPPTNHALNCYFFFFFRKRLCIIAAGNLSNVPSYITTNRAMCSTQHSPPPPLF